MVQAISAVRSYVSAVPPITQQQRVEQIKLERNEVTDDLRNGKISDIQAMSEQVNLDSKLSDARAQAASIASTRETPEIKYVSKPEQVSRTQEIQPANVSAMDRQQKGKEMSQAERQQVVENQMRQMAINNQVLHGLVAV